MRAVFVYLGALAGLVAAYAVGFRHGREKAANDLLDADIELFAERCGPFSEKLDVQRLGEEILRGARKSAVWYPDGPDRKLH